MFLVFTLAEGSESQVRDFLADHRDAYKYLHDQTVRMMNLGLTGDEIAARIQLPPALANSVLNHTTRPS